jgi:transposase
VQAVESTRQLANEPRVVRKFFRALEAPCKIAVESTANWYWLVDLLQELELDVVLSNPVQTKAIAHARIKNDKVDAQTLAQLLSADLLPTCWMPTRADRNIRELLRTRLGLLVFRTRFKNIIRSVLAKFNINLEHSNIWDGAGRDDLESVLTPNDRKTLNRLTLDPPYPEIIHQALVHVDLLTEQIADWETKIHRLVKITPAARQLTTVPGIGELSALTILYESGPMDRFPSAKHYTSYAGLVPRCLGSAGKYWRGKLFKQANMYLKRIYIEIALAAMRARQTDTRLKAFYRHTFNRKGMAVARIALARKIAGIVYHMQTKDIDYATCMTYNKMAGQASTTL